MKKKSQKEAEKSDKKTCREFRTKITSQTKTVGIMDIYDGVNKKVKYLRLVLDNHFCIKMGTDTISVSLVIERSNKIKMSGPISLTDLKALNCSNIKSLPINKFIDEISSQITKEVAKEYCGSGNIFKFKKPAELTAHNSLKHGGLAEEDTGKKYAVVGAYLDYAGIHYEMKAGNVKQKLIAGNKRYLSNSKYETSISKRILKKLSSGQKPYAIVVCCSDSRVVPELVFSAGMGELFVIRIAGNVIDSHQLGSIEYAAEHLGASLIVVLGHTSCGAIEAVLKKTGGVYVKYIVDEIKQAIGKEKDPYKAYPQDHDPPTPPCACR